MKYSAVEAAAGSPPGEVERQVGPQTVPSVVVEKVIELVKLTCVAFSNLSLYPPTHKIVVEGVHRAFERLTPILGEQGKIIISFADGKLLFAGLPLEEKNPTVHKFARHFEALKVHSLLLRDGLDEEEFRRFFVAFHREPAAIQQAGGLKATLDEAQITHIETNTAVYKLITEEEMVVQKGVHIDEAAPVASSDQEVVQYLVHEILTRRKGDKEFFDELKNNPSQLADQIVAVIDKFGTDQSVDQESLVQAVLQNIEMVGQNIAQQQPGEGGTAKELSSALASLEYELKRKSAALGSKAATQFLKRITEVVSSYSMRAKAGVILNEFLENERSLKSVEAMLKELSPDATTGRRLLENLRRLMEQRNLAADDLVQLIENDIAQKEKPKRASRTFKPLVDRLKSKLAEKSYNLASAAQEELVGYLDSVFCREIKQAVRDASEPLESELARHKFVALKEGRALEAAGIGVILLDHAGNVCHVQFQDMHIPGIEPGKPLPSDLEKAVQETPEGTALRYENISIFGSIKDESGKLDTILFQPVQPASAVNPG